MGAGQLWSVLVGSEHLARSASEGVNKERHEDDSSAEGKERLFPQGAKLSSSPRRDVKERERREPTLQSSALYLSRLTWAEVGLKPHKQRSRGGA